MLQRWKNMVYLFVLIPCRFKKQILTDFKRFLDKI